MRDMILRTCTLIALPIARFLERIGLACLQVLLLIFCRISRHSKFATWTLRIVTLLCLTYLVADRISETGATVSSPASDPKDPFYFPFSVTNNSHIFTLRNIEWTCRLVSLKVENWPPFPDAGSFISSAPKIDPGGVINVSCKQAFRSNTRSDELLLLSLAIELKYDTYFFGLNVLTRNFRTVFTWAISASNPQWIKGENARSGVGR